MPLRIVVSVTFSVKFQSILSSKTARFDEFLVDDNFFSA